MMKTKIVLWLADVFWDALKIFAGRIHDWFFSEDRAARLRMKKREWWWARSEKAKATENPRDDMRARFWQILDDFETPPADAVARGDLHGNHP